MFPIAGTKQGSQPEMTSITVAQVLEAVADDESISILKHISQKGGRSGEIRDALKLTRKKYYARLYKLNQCGLVRKKDEKYVLSTFGKVVLDMENNIETALNNYWKIKALDSLRLMSDIPADEHKKLVDSLLPDNEIKKILAA